MNYILEIKAFYDWLETNQLPTSAIALWHALMHIANKTGWQDNFAVAVVVLEIKTGLKKRAIINARTTLQNKGLISFSSRGGNQSATYQMHSLVALKDTQIGTQAEYKNFECIKSTQSDPQYSPQHDPQSDPQSDPINKQNKTKQNKTIYISSSETLDEGRSVPVFDTDSFEMLASRYLRDNILERIPHARVPKDERGLQKWAVHIERLKRLDGLNENDIRALIKFATTDTFWQANILSTAKLREKKDTLYAQMKAGKGREQKVGGDMDFSNLPKGAKGLYEWIQKQGD